MTRTLTVVAGVALMLGGVGMVVNDLADEPAPPPTVAIDAGASSAPEPTAEPREPAVRGREARRADPRTPTGVRVPELGIDVQVVPIGLGDGGVLTPPDDPQVLGRWDGSALADGKRGAMLLTGHTVSTGGGALDDLETLAEGAEVTVGTPRGAVAYEVESTDVRSKAWVAENAAELFGQDGRHRLVLVTCEDYDPATGEYGSNVVVIGYPTR